LAEFDGFKKTGIDADIEALIREHCENFNINSLDAVKLFPVLARRQLLKRFLAHTEFFKMTLDIPGDIVELGVFRGLGLMTWANLLECYCIGDRTKRVIGFDNWVGFKKFSEEDGEEDSASQKVIDGFSPANYKQELLDAISIFDKDRFIPWKKRVLLVDGDIEDSAPLFIEENPGIRLSLVHFDCDLYAPTKAALDAFWPRLSRGGIFMFDEYAMPDWPGETKAVDEFLADKPNIKIKKLRWTNAPAGYLIKE
jgi:hypothetical protein